MAQQVARIENCDETVVFPLILADVPARSFELALEAVGDGLRDANLGSVHPWFVRDPNVRNTLGLALWTGHPRVSKR